MKPARWAVQYALTLAAVVVAVVVAGTIRQARAGRQEVPVPAVTAVPVIVLRGSAAPDSWRIIQAAYPESTRQSLVIALRAADSHTCEDLGRQLRELRHASGTEDRAVVVVAPAKDSSAVRSWLRRERLGDLPVVGSIGGLHLVGLDSVPTPAALLLDSAGKVERGIAHPQRVTNVRVRSFSAELGLTD